MYETPIGLWHKWGAQMREINRNAWKIKKNIGVTKGQNALVSRSMRESWQPWSIQNQYLKENHNFDKIVLETEISSTHLYRLGKLHITQRKVCKPLAKPQTLCFMSEVQKRNDTFLPFHNHAIHRNPSGIKVSFS